MPNWVENVLIITGNKTSVEELKQKLNISNIGDKLETFFELFVNENIVSSCEWNIRNWGTKWDVDECEVTSLSPFTLKFCTAWNPPVTFLKKIAKKYPSIIFTLAYFEIGQQFYGAMIIQNDFCMYKLHSHFNSDDKSECIYIDEDEGKYEKYKFNEDYLIVDEYILSGELRRFYEKYGFRSLGG